MHSGGRLPVGTRPNKAEPWFRTVRLVGARSLLCYRGQRMPSFDDASALVRNGEIEPALVIFVSHRWRDTLHPDPDGRTLRAICQVLRALVALARGLDPQDAAPVPSLEQPAMLQASVLLYRMLEKCELEGNQVLDRLAVFFDFSCLPQGHTAADQERLRVALEGLPSIVPDPIVTLLALREPGDAYATRAWCVAESVMSLQYDNDRPWIYTFPLRMDLEPVVNTVEFDPLRAAIEKWSREVSGRLRITQDEFQDWLQIVQLCVDWHEKARDEAMLTLHHSPDIAKESFRLWIEITTRLAAGGAKIVNVAPMVHEVTASAGLQCTNPDDILITGLLILAGLRWEELNRNSGAPSSSADPEADFWRLCLSRFLEGGALNADVRPRLSRQEGVLVPPICTLVAE